MTAAILDYPDIPPVADLHAALAVLATLDRRGFTARAEDGKLIVNPGDGGGTLTAEDREAIRGSKPAMIWLLLNGPSPAEIAASDKSDASGKRQIFPRNTQPQTLSDLIAPAKEESET